MKTIKIKSLDILSVANIVALIYLALSPIYFILSLIMESIVITSFFDGLYSFVSLLVVLTILSWVISAVFALLYNLFAARTGGINIKVE